MHLYLYLYVVLPAGEIKLIYISHLTTVIFFYTITLVNVKETNYRKFITLLHVSLSKISPLI